MAEDKKKWKREISAGGVVYKKQKGQIFVLMIMPTGRKYGPPEGYWAFPKGKIDEGEDKRHAALREVKEETGVQAKIMEDLSYVKFFRNYDQTLKFVHYFLMEYALGKLADHDREVAKVKWFKLSEIESHLKWPADKEVFERAKKILENV
ncbi:MAG: NUDIX domain-containing protein [Candidatus Doudnabacteria bacterium]